MNKNIPTSKLPSRSEGMDGETRFVADKGTLYLYRKYNGEWYRIQMEKV